MTSLALPGPLVETRFIERPNRFLLRCAPAPAGDRVRKGRAPYAGDAAGDVVYGGEWDFAATGSLRSALEGVLTETPPPQE